MFVVKRVASVAILPFVAALLAVGLSTSPVAAMSTTTSAFAGYSVKAAGTSFDVTLKVPSFKCTVKRSIISAGIQTYDAPNSGDNGSMIVFYCSKTLVPSYYAELEVDGNIAEPQMSIGPGNLVTMTVTCGTDGTDISLLDPTINQDAYTGSDSPSTCTDSQFGDIGYGKDQSAIPDFGLMRFSQANENGDALGSLSPKVHNYNEGTGKVITTGALTHGGLNFNTTDGS